MITPTDATAIREALGLTGRAMAAALGVHRRTIENADQRGASGSLAAVYRLIVACAAADAIRRFDCAKSAQRR